MNNLIPSIVLILNSIMFIATIYIINRRIDLQRKAVEAQISILKMDFNTLSNLYREIINTKGEKVSRTNQDADCIVKDMDSMRENPYSDTLRTDLNRDGE